MTKVTDKPPECHTEVTVARARECPLCQAASGTPCQPKPEGDHLARYRAGRILAARMVAASSRPVPVSS